MSNFIEIESAEGDVLACATFLAERIGSAEGHAASISDVALRYAAKGELDLAAQLADTISDPHTRDVVLSEVAVRCADFDDDEYGVQLAEAVDDYGFQQQALHNLAVRQADNDRLENALTTAEKVDDPAATYGEIAIRFAHKGDEAGAMSLLEKVDLPHLKAQVFNEIAVAQTKRNESSENSINEMLNAVAGIEIAEEKLHFLLEVAARYQDAGQKDSALGILEQAKHEAEPLEPRFRDQALAQTALLYARAGEFEQAENTLKPIDDLQQTASAHTAIALEHSAAGDAERAAASLEEAYAVLKSQPERHIRDSKSRFNLFATIAIRFAQLGKPERGLEIALENPDEEPRHIALTNIAAVCQAQSNWELARQAATSLEQPAPRVYALIGMSDAELQKGNAEIAAELLNEANGLTEEVNQLPLRSQVLNELAIRYANRDDKAKSAELLHQSLLTVQQIVDQSHQSAALAGIAETYDKTGLQITEAEQDILSTIIRKRLSSG
jgi:tetratricopeptide (TPR) repeat protein